MTSVYNCADIYACTWPKPSLISGWASGVTPAGSAYNCTKGLGTVLMLAGCAHRYSEAPAAAGPRAPRTQKSSLARIFGMLLPLYAADAAMSLLLLENCLKILDAAASYADLASTLEV